MSQVGGFAEVIVIFFLPGLVVGGAVTPDGASVVAGSVVNDNAAFLVFGVLTSLFAGASDPPQALMTRSAVAVRARALARGEIFIDPTYLLVVGAAIHPASSGAVNSSAQVLFFTHDITDRLLSRSCRGNCGCCRCWRCSGC